MHNGDARLAQDVAVLAAMAEQMAEYLDSDVLHWPAPRGGMPTLTLGGYLLREHRLLALREQLTAEQQAQVDAAVAAFNQALADRVVRSEAKAHRELEARLRQWEEYLKDMDRGTFDRASNYDTAVETRAMIAALMNRLSLPPYRLEARPQQHLATLDTRLQGRWQPGDFVWPAEWAAAYPRGNHWWLYGAPRVSEERH
ncbi:conserved protein of unknown function [Candidatus Promineifilum breve]|uniref:Uncharacterized protein n=1 Tax=Candidatus Promineifilum breve TaxID=1806508 RepID=A0A170PGZ0_9CHLR|nr:hypothetical protein [Candidatus Promineifilum breve]CUS04017.2 conserved protein of unknown function [Candidatus Promineifilum breve]